MRPIILLLLAAVALPAQTLTIVSGNGQIVLEQFLSTVPLVVQATDASGKPAAGVNVTWAVTQGMGTLQGAPTVPTDANGQVPITFLATGVPPGTSFTGITVSATSGGSTVNFVLTTVLSRQTNGGLAAPPIPQLVTPQPGGTVSGAAGSTIPGGLQILVVAQSGAQAGQPVPNVGVRIHPSSNPSLPSAVCNAPGGTVLTNAQGLAVCDLVLGPQTGSTPVTAIVGEAQDTPNFTLTVTPGVSCSFTISPTAPPSVALAGGTGTVNVGTTAGCTWTVASNASWITPSQTSGTGSGSVGYTVAANTEAARSGTLTIAGQVVTITQAGTSGQQPLTITTSATLPFGTLNQAYSTVFAASGGSGQYTWTALGTLPPGLQLSAAGTLSGVTNTTGNFSFNVSVKDAVNGATQSQTFTLAVVGSSGGLVITTTSLPNGGVGQAYQQNLVSTLGCSSPFSPTPVFRVISGALPPGLAIQQISGVYAIAGTPTTAGSYSFTVSATDACGNAATASLTIVIGGGQATALNVTPTSLQFNVVSGSSASPPNQNLSLSSTPALTFSATASTATGAGWLSLTNSSGSTPASIVVSVSNTSQLAPGNYTGSITISSASSPVIVPVSLVVSAQQDTLVLTPPSFSVTLKNSGSNTSLSQSLAVGSGGTQLQFTATSSTANGSSWLTIDKTSGTTPAILTVTTNAANLSPGSYTGSVVVSTARGPQTVAITMTVVSGSSLSVMPNALTFSVAPAAPNVVPAPQTLALSAFPGSYNFTAKTSTADGGTWLAVTPSTGVTPATINVSVNNTGLSAGTYSGVVSIQASDPTIPVTNVPVTLNVAPSIPSIVALTNAASFAPGAIAPGELVTIYGSQLGPQTPVSGVGTALGGTQVTFDNIAAPLLYTSAGQVNAIVPFEVAGRVSTTVQMSYNGALSGSLNIRVVDSSPAIFVVDPSGQGAILNQDSSVNSSNNPATAGSFISIYATGGGQTSPPGVDGQILTPAQWFDITPPLLVLPVTVQVGGMNALVQYSGSAPGLVAGVVQVNALVPAGAPHGNQVPVTLTVGGQISPTVFVAIQ